MPRSNFYTLCFLTQLKKIKILINQLRYLVVCLLTKKRFTLSLFKKSVFKINKVQILEDPWVKHMRHHLF